MSRPVGKQRFFKTIVFCLRPPDRSPGLNCRERERERERKRERERDTETDEEREISCVRARLK